MILQDKLHSFIIQDDRNTRFPSTTNYKNNNIIKRFYRENSPLDGAVQSGQSAIYVVCRVIKGFEQKLSKKYILIQLTKSPVRPADSEFCQALKFTMQAVGYLNER